MINILLNKNNFGEKFAKKRLRSIIRRKHRVLIIPLSYHEDYINTAEDYEREFSKGSPEIEDIIKEFAKYGIARKNIRILNYYIDNKETIDNKFRWADILFFTGGYPDRALMRIDELSIRNNITQFNGIVMGTSAGAMIQFDEYHVTPEEEGGEYEYHVNGLGLLSGFDIEVHYVDNQTHLSGIVTALNEKGKPVYAMPDESGLLIINDTIESLGEVIDFNIEDADMVQFVLDELVR